MRDDIRTLDLKSAITPITKFEGVEEIYLFGSRAYKTGSVRSDIDILVYAPSGVNQTDADEAFGKECALDIFETVDKINARSLVNDSRISRTDLINKLDAVLVWSKDSDFLPKVDEFSDMKLLLEYDFKKTNLPVISANESAFYKEFGRYAIFMIMPFAEKYKDVYKKIKDYMNIKGYKVVRADDKWFLPDVWPNVKLYLECCKKAVALFTDTPKKKSSFLFKHKGDQYNANVALEVGYMMSKGGSVLMLKEKGVARLFSDIQSVMYEEIDLSKLDKDIPRILDAWIDRDLK